MHKYAWFRFSDHSWVGSFDTRLDAAKASMKVQSVFARGKTAPIKDDTPSGRRIHTDSIVRFTTDGSDIKESSLDRCQSSIR